MAQFHLQHMLKHAGHGHYGDSVSETQIFATTLQNKSLVKLKKDYDRNITIIRYYIV